MSDVCMITFTDSRKTKLSIERENYLKNCHKELKNFLISKNYNIIDPHYEIKINSDTFGFNSIESTKKVINCLKGKDLGVIILEANYWSEPNLPLLLVKELNIPTIIYTTDNPSWPGSVGLSSWGAALKEVYINNSAAKHVRVYDDKEKLIKYINAFLALSNIKRSNILLFGGSYCLSMNFLRDDYDFLKSFIIEDIIEIDQYTLIEKAKSILENQSNRVNDFLNWLNNNGTKINYDNNILTEDVLKSQIALYFAAKDITQEYQEVIGISVKCQPTLSEEFGITGCLIPTFMPYLYDSEGKKRIINTTCEGDVKGLITSCLLNLIVPAVPALFGDIKYIGKDYFIISNCGGSSLFYSANSNDYKKCLTNLTISPQCQGKSGGSCGYNSMDDIVTIARLVREYRKYKIQYSVTNSIQITEDIKSKILWGKMWPHTVLKLKSSREYFIDIIGSNHYSVIKGDVALEIETISKYLDIETEKF